MELDYKIVKKIGPYFGAIFFYCFFISPKYDNNKWEKIRVNVYAMTGSLVVQMAVNVKYRIVDKPTNNIKYIKKLIKVFMG